MLNADAQKYSTSGDLVGLEDSRPCLFRYIVRSVLSGHSLTVTGRVRDASSITASGTGK